MSSSFISVAFNVGCTRDPGNSDSRFFRLDNTPELSLTPFFCHRNLEKQQTASMWRMKLSEGLILSGYPSRATRQRADVNNRQNTNDELLKGALATVVNAGCNVNSVQVELLKGAMAGEAYSNGLTATAEHIIATITNSNWIDREMMRKFFLEKVGFGSELSLRSGSLCVERGIPSPQRLAMLFHSQTEFPSWLRLTVEETVLLRIALFPYFEQQRHHLSERDSEDDGPDAVWADVDSSEADPSDSEFSASEGNSTSQLRWTEKKEALGAVSTHLLARGTADGNSPLLEVVCSRAPPSTPQDELRTSALAFSPSAVMSVDTFQSSAESQLASFVSAMTTDPSCTIATNDLSSTRAVSLRLSLPSELEELSPLDSTPGTSDAGGGCNVPLSTRGTSDSARASEPSERSGEAQHGSVTQPSSTSVDSMMSSYDSCSLPIAAEPPQREQSRDVPIPQLTSPGTGGPNKQGGEMEGVVYSYSSYSSHTSSYGFCALLGYHRHFPNNNVNSSNHACSAEDLDATADADWLSSPGSSPLPSTPSTPRSATAAAAEGAAVSPLTVSATSCVTDTDKGHSMGQER